MKALPLFLAAGLLFSTTLLSQETKVIRFNNNRDDRDSILKIIYRYPQFILGTVYFQNGTTTGAYLNYNRYFDEMQYLDPKRDTLTIANPETIQYIVVRNDTFYHNRGYVQRVAGNKNATLSVKDRLKLLDRQKIGGYGLPTSAGSVETFNGYYDGTKMNPLKVNEDIVLQEETTYYFSNSNRGIRQATKKNVLLLFPKHERAITNFLNDQAIDFTRVDDLRKLVAFLQELR